MQDVVKHLRGWVIEGRLEDPCEVMVIYQDANAEQVAGLLCRRLEQELHDEVKFVFTWLPLHKLASTHCRQVAAHSAATADLITFSLQDELPKPAKDLMRDCTHYRTKRKGAIIGLVDGKPNKTEKKSNVHRELEALSSEMGFQYWAPMPWNPPSEMPDSIESYLSRADKVTPLLLDILHH